MGESHTLDYQPPQRRPRFADRFLRAFPLIFAGGLVVFVIGAILPGLLPHHTGSPRIFCASNLKQIGLAMIMYANDHQDHYPDSLQPILAEEDIAPEVFICPSSGDTRAMGATTQATVAALATPHHCSYIYLAKGLIASTTNADTVFAYEPLTNHKNSGMNVLFSDGHVDFIAAPGVLPWIAAANGGPVTRPALAP